MKLNPIALSFGSVQRTKMSPEEFKTYYDSLYPGSEEENVDPHYCGTTQPFDDDFEGYGSRPIPPARPLEELEAESAKARFEAEQAARKALDAMPRMSPEEFAAYYDSLYPGSEEDRVDSGCLSSVDYPDDNY